MATKTQKIVILGRPLYVIAIEIRKDWKKEVSGTKLSPHAEPYLNAMQSLDKITENFGWDSGREIVARFLGNATSWKGENAKRIKAELNAMLKR